MSEHSTSLRSFPGNEAHKLLSGGPKVGGFWVGPQKVYVGKVHVLLPSPSFLGSPQARDRGKMKPLSLGPKALRAQRLQKFQDRPPALKFSYGRRLTMWSLPPVHAKVAGEKLIR